MASDGGLVRFDGIDFDLYNRRTTPEMQSDLVNALLEDGAGTLWIATSNGLLSLKAGRLTRYDTGQGLGSAVVLALHQDRAHHLCATTVTGTDCLTPSGFIAGSNGQKPPASQTRHVTTSDGSQWTVTPTGLERVQHDRSTLIAMPEGFTGQDILSLYADREGNLWAGSENAGAVILRHPPFTTLGKKDGLATDQIRSLVQTQDGDLWFGTAAGLTRQHQGKFATITVAQGLPSNEIIALAPSADGSVWAGTPDGLSHLTRGRITTLTADDGLPDDDIRSLLEARDHSLWIGTTHGLAHLRGRRTLQTYSTGDGLPSNTIGSLLEDDDGSLWIGTRAGLVHLQKGKLRSYAGKDGLKSTIITALGKDASGTLWIGTAGGGLYEWKDGRLLHARVPVADLPDTIYSVLADKTGRIWLSTSDGIFQIGEAELHALAENASISQPGITRYDVSDGLRINDSSSGGHPEAMRAADGYLYFATSKGVSVVDPGNFSQQPAAPPIVIESLLVDDTAASELTNVHVDAGHERVAFHYAGLNFAAPYTVRYRYQLAPFDKQWIDAGSRRTAYYTNIPPGRYCFRVAATTDGSTWSQRAAEVAVVIAPHYYQTWWFYTAVAILLVLIGWQLYLYRLHQIELRFSAVLAERSRIAREIHDTLAQDIVAISVQLDLIARLMMLSVEKAREQLVTTRDLVRRSLAEARSSIWDLRSSSSAIGDLPTRLRETLRQVLGDSDLKLNLTVTGTYRAASRQLEDEFLRIAQEAATNTLRHAQAQTLAVALTYTALSVELRVHDDGRGFTPVAPNTGPPGHYGIRGMHERAERAKAALAIKSAPGSGTTVLASARIS